MNSNSSFVPFGKKNLRNEIKINIKNKHKDEYKGRNLIYKIFLYFKIRHEIKKEVKKYDKLGSLF